MNAPRTRVIVVGQTPPPYGGQAIMIQRLLEQTYEGVDLHHVRMGYSREMKEVGSFRLRKVAHLITLVFRVARARLRTKADVLYYPPAGPDLVPIYRDIVFLISVRWMFRRTIFHFEAGGLTEVLDSLNVFQRKLFLAAYGRPDVVIRLSERLPEDGKRLQAKQELIVPNAIPDLEHPLAGRRSAKIPTILFVGVVRRSKGVEVLLRAAGELKGKDLGFRLEIVGEPSSAVFVQEMQELVEEEGLDEVVHWRGLLIDADKDDAYAKTDIFCFPSFFESETTPIVLMEAMRAGLPIVSTTWRGIPDIVEDGVTGFLTPIEDPGSVARGLERLIIDPALRRRMGTAGRDAFEARFTLDHYRDGIQRAFDACADL